MNGSSKNFWEKLNPIGECRRYKISLWQCPPFLFLLMGALIIGAILATYYIANQKINNPQVVVLIVLIVASVLVVIDYIITRSFERMSEASRLKTEFISVVSHQLRSPLTNLKFSLEALIEKKAGKISKTEMEYFYILRENTRRMGDLINDLLLVSRIETDRLPLRETEVSLSELIKKLIFKFKEFAEASNVKLKLRAKKNLPKVFVDPVWLEQIIGNLLDNAIRYINQKGEVEIRVYPKDKKIFFEIEDSGVGIPEKEQRYIFKKFFRSKNVLKYQTEGSGLGLYICRKVIELMGGKIWFRSKEGKGTTFFFTLPIREATKIKVK